MNIFFNLSFFENTNNNNENTQMIGIAIDAKDIALLKSIIHAATNDTQINATAVLHCNIIVAIVHVPIDLNNVFVVFWINVLNEFVVNFFIASSKRNIHKINNHNHPINSNIVSNIKFFQKYKIYPIIIKVFLKHKF